MAPMKAMKAMKARWGASGFRLAGLLLWKMQVKVKDFAGTDRIGETQKQLNLIPFGRRLLGKSSCCRQQHACEAMKAMKAMKAGCAGDAFRADLASC